MPAPDLLPPNQILLEEARRKRSSQIMVVIAFLCVLVPFLFWRGTWFGRPLTEEETGQYLSDPEKPRHIQHALVQIGQRIERGDTTAQRWYPQVVQLAKSPYLEIRVTLAWVMGADNHSEEFHRALLGLLADSSPLVRRNAALSLVRFGDAAGKPELLSMLRLYSAGGSGDGALSPGSEQVWEALRALYLVGQASDLPDVERFAAGTVPGIPARIQQQAVLTAAEIRRRPSQNSQ
jgi:hypothetical protein